MKIVQRKEFHELVFSDEEIKLINEKKKIIFNHKGMSQFANAMAKILADIVQAIPKEELQMNVDDSINPTEKECVPAYSENKSD